MGGAGGYDLVRLVSVNQRATTHNPAGNLHKGLARSENLPVFLRDEPSTKDLFLQHVVCHVLFHPQMLQEY